MTARIALAMAAVAVLAAGLYLFVEVRSPEASAQPKAPASPAAPVTSPVVAKEVGSAPPPPPVAPPQAPVQEPVVGMPGPRGLHHADQNVEVVEEKLDVKLDAIMDQANKAYDRGDFDEAKAVAGKVLVKQPNNVRMLRIMVSSSCIDGDSITAQKYYVSLPKFDREQMKTRCDRYGVTFTDQ